MKKELLFYARCEVVKIGETKFVVSVQDLWPRHEVLPLADAPWVKHGQKIAVEMAYHTSPLGGSKMRVTTISSVEKDAQ